MTTGSQGLAWQIGVWDQISQIYRDEIDPRFEVLGFDFDDFDSAWNVLAGVTAARLPPDDKKKPKPLCARRCGRTRHCAKFPQHCPVHRRSLPGVDSKMNAKPPDRATTAEHHTKDQ